MSYYTNAREEVLPFVPEAADRILDVGCATGGFGEALKKRRPGSVVVHGIEMDADAASMAQDRLDAVVCAEFGKSAVETLRGDQPYSCIVFNDVLEHMLDPGAALDIARNSLTENGYVVASIPNIRNWNTMDQILRGGRFRYADKGVLDRTHVRFFCLQDMIALFEDSGMAVLTSQGINSLNLKNWQRWHLVSRILGGGLAVEGRYEQFVLVARRNQ